MWKYEETWTSFFSCYVIVPNCKYCKTGSNTILIIRHGDHKHSRIQREVKNLLRSPKIFKVQFPTGLNSFFLNQDSNTLLCMFWPPVEQIAWNFFNISSLSNLLCTVIRQYWPNMLIYSNKDNYVHGYRSINNVRVTSPVSIKTTYYTFIMCVTFILYALLCSKFYIFLIAGWANSLVLI